MEKIVSNLIKKILIPKFGPMKYNVFYDGTSKNLNITYTYSFSPDEKYKEIADEMKMLLSALGLSNIKTVKFNSGFIIYGSVDNP